MNVTINRILLTNIWQTRMTTKGSTVTIVCKRTFSGLIGKQADEPHFVNQHVQTEPNKGKYINHIMSTSIFQIRL